MSTATQMAVIYGMADMSVHRVIVPDADGQLPPSIANPGEAVIYVGIANAANLELILAGLGVRRT